MASHFVSLSRGVEGEKYVDFVTGAASSGEANGIEVRIDDAATLTRTDVEKIMLAMTRFFENPQQFVTAGFLGVKG
jgi:hypothetical protein